MSIPALTIIPAGAGSGKTYTIQKKLAEWIAKGDVAPEKIAAVTFTEAAASELKGRIRSQLVEDGRLEDALRMDQSYISTIHGFGLRMLTDFAFDAGISPSPRKLNEDEENILIRLALAETDHTEAIAGRLASFGYKYKANVGKDAEELFRDAVLQMINKRRSIGKTGDDADILRHAKEHIRDLYGTQLGKAERLKKELLDAVKALLKKFPENLSSCFARVNDSAEKALRNNFDALTRASGGEALDTDWELWNSLRKLRVSGQRGKLPAGYKEMAEEVMKAAEGIMEHPGPLEDALLHASVLIGASGDAFKQYDKGKKSKGLIDFYDMLAQAYFSVLQMPGILRVLKDNIDCLVIDEFQDTNPLQFALLWSLRKAGVPTLIVGDLKQAIMGFQDADPRLMEQLERKYERNIELLTNNYRSTPKLMDWINEVGKGIFGEKYTKLSAKAKDAGTLAPLEAILFSQRGKKQTRAQHTALRIANLLKEKQKVFDRSLGGLRPLRPSDIAVLCFTNDRLADYGSALESLGIKSRMDQDGWSESRVVQILYHALSYIADPSDKHAALYLMVTRLGDRDLETGLKAMITNNKPDSPVLDALARVAAMKPDATVSERILDVIRALDLYGKISRWPDAGQERANLLRFQGMADQFESANREALASGRFYGSGIKTFLSWLCAVVEDDNGQPAPGVVDEQAVQLITWHSSKGREWPVVVVCGLEAKVEARLPRFDVWYRDFSNLDSILDIARINIYPEFPQKEKTDDVKGRLQQGAKEDARRLLYVILTRAREKLILEWDGYIKSDSRAYWNLLKSEANLSIADGVMTVAGKKFPCVVTETTDKTPSAFEKVGGIMVPALPVTGRRAIKPGPVPESLTPDSIIPSSMHGAEVKEKLKLASEAYANPIEDGLTMPSEKRGTVLHRCFEVMGEGLRDRSIIERAISQELADGDFSVIRSAVEKFENWIEVKFKPVSTKREVPVLAANAQGSVVSGSADLVIETREGTWIIDHKSDKTDDLEERFLYYLPQLMTYKDAVSSALSDKPVLGLGINWISSGKVMLQKF